MHHTPHSSRTAFTALELIIAMALGMMVMLIAFTAVRVAAQTISTVGRLSLQNQVLRAGYQHGLEELDFWTSMDDPYAAAGTPGRALRQQATTRFGRTGPSDAYGGPFTAMADLAPDNESANGGVGFSPLRTGDNTLRTDLQLRDDVDHNESNDGGGDAEPDVFSLDLDRGPEPSAYQANDPRRWFHGYLLDPDGSDRRYGRYGMLANKRRFPVLGFGNDPRTMGNYRDFVSADNAPGRQLITGPYGPYPPLRYDRGSGGDITARTHTWYDNQVLYYWKLLGSYGVSDYLPSNHILRVTSAMGHYDPASGLPPAYTAAIASGTMSSPILVAPNEAYVQIDEKPDLRLNGFRNKTFFWSDDSRLGNIWSGCPSTLHGMTVQNYYSIQAGDLNSGNARTASEIINDHHRTWDGPESHWFDYAPTIRANTRVRSMLPQRPKNWPGLRMELMRGMYRGRFFNVIRIRWMDTATNEQVEIPLTAIGTTLRGARQQRHRSTGWAAWHKPGDPRNDPSLDTPP